MLRLFVIFVAVLSLPIAAAALSHETIVEGAKRCCRPEPEMQECCVRKIQNGSAKIGCPPPEWKIVGACFEKFFWNTSVIERNVYKCCDLLHTSRCRRACSFAYRIPSLSPEIRDQITFDADCIDLTQLVDDCRKDSILKQHECLGRCLRLRRENPPGFHFDQLTHCPGMDIESLDGCIGPSNLLDFY
ncbi:hypothetical protein L596_011278 [Steinernema carpocapsae]|uniref:Domain of unknown function DB domain-containing protein n=1 Tax=Steinernema carpocapsae TaxID=34508 RepID=A0A4U5NUA2_STECR|nr:hypothetical protein L596_011278 [Steinernema carpocapsae]